MTKTEPTNLDEDEVIDVAVEVVEEKSLAVMPAMTLEQGSERYSQMRAFVKQEMVEGKDYGIIPGTEKPSLWQPGAQKLATFFGLSINHVLMDHKEVWGGDDPFFMYRYRAIITRNGVILAEVEGSANSKETRYRWRWVDEDQVPTGLDLNDLESKVSSKGRFQWQIDKADTTGQYGKPAEYWQEFVDAMLNKKAKVYDKKQTWGEQKDAPFVEIESVSYRIPNPEIFSLVNTIQKIAQKRAFVAAVIIAANASEFFTQDMEDITDDQKNEKGKAAPQQTKTPVKKVNRPAKKSAKENVKDLGYDDDPTPPKAVKQHIPVNFKNYKKTQLNEAIEKALQLTEAEDILVTHQEFWSFGNLFGFDGDYLNEVVSQSVRKNINDQKETDWKKALTTIVVKAMETIGE